MLDAGAEPLQRRCAAGIEAGDNVVVVIRITRNRVCPDHLKQTLGVDCSLERLTNNAGRIIEAEEGIPQAVLGAAEIRPDAGGGEAVAALFHKIGPACDIAAGWGDAAAGVLDEAAGDQVGPGREGFTLLGELAVAVVNKDHGVGVGGADNPGDFFNRGQVEGVALGVATAALDVDDGRGAGLLCNDVVIRGEIGA